jgi:hypothetical protein
MTRVIAVKGSSKDAANMLVGSPSPVDVSISGQKIKEGYKVWPVATAVAKGELYPWLKLRPPTAEAIAQGETHAPGFCHFPQYDEDYFKQFTSEQLVPIRKHGRREWVWQQIRTGRITSSMRGSTRARPRSCSASIGSAKVIGRARKGDESTRAAAGRTASADRTAWAGSA